VPPISHPFARTRAASRTSSRSRRVPIDFAIVVASAMFAVSCATYRGTAAPADSTLPRIEPGWVWVSGVPAIEQEGSKDCGAAALAAVLGYWGTRTTADEVDTAVRRPSREGIAAGELTAYARSRGFDAYVFHGATADIEKELAEGRPVIVGVAKPYGDRWLKHYEVVAGFHPRSQSVLTFDPARGWQKNALPGFLTEWDPVGRILIVVFPASREADRAATR
jgi:ABC-type bacteriocin/lantibiotic exporter with double-glycine peptidase domain